MKNYLFAFLLCLLFSLHVWADTAAPEVNAPAPPDLQHLSAGWWGYFDQAGDQREQRLDGLLEQVRRLHGKDVDTMRPELEQAVEAYRASLQKKNAPEPVALPERHKQYTLDELFDLDAKLQGYESELLSRQNQLNELGTKINTLDKGLQQLKLRYINLAVNDTTRIGVALEWVTQQLRLASFRNEQALRQTAQQTLRQQDATWQEILSYASDHLTYTRELEGESVSQQLEAVQQERARLKTELDTLELETLAAADSTPLDKVRSRLGVQKKLNAEVRQAKLQLQEMRLQAKIYLEQLLAADPGTDYKAMREFLRDARIQLIQTPDKLRSWRQQGSYGRDTGDGPDENGESPHAVKDETSKVTRQALDLADETLSLIDGLDKSLPRDRLMLELLDKQLLKTQGGAKAAVSAVADTAGSVVQFSLDSLHKPLFEINETPITVISIVRFLVILLLSWVFSSILRSMLRKVDRRQGEAYTGSLFMIRRVLHYAIVIIGFMIGLSSIGIDVSKFALIATALSIGIGFGLQNIINNFVSGIILLFEKSIKIGDFVELESGSRGLVREMRVRSTVITTNDNVDIVVPNSEFVSGRVVNWTMSEAHRRIHVPFGVAYGTDKELVRRVILEAARHVPYTLKNPTRQPQVWLVGFGDSALNFELVVWLTSEAVKRPAAVHAHYCWEIETALSKHSIEIPFPQRDLHIRTAPGLERNFGLKA
jgi:small-conductance mechanosensitive channel